ncbi:MAG: membrane protein insertase YidC [Alphaproteobacteria bacterium]|nr:membrane protein insertase YidC [Alphaproteobacteria bacterium]
MIEQRNLIVAIVLSVLIVLGFQYFNDATRPKPKPGDGTPTTATEATPQPRPGTDRAAAADAPPMPPGTSVAPTDAAARSARDEGPRVAIQGERLHGSLRLRGARFDDITLADYRETVDRNSPEVRLLTPAGNPHPYYATFGWVATDKSVTVPGDDTLWTASERTLSVGAPLTLTWDNGQGLVFRQVIEIDGNFMFTVARSVENRGAVPVTLHGYGLIARTDTPETAAFYILHEGLLGVFNGTLQEITYDDMREEGTRQLATTGGWIGITDKYWAGVLVPDQAAPVTARFVHAKREGRDRYQTDFLREAVTILPNGSVSATDRLFAGAKEVRLVDYYEQELGITRFDRTIDFGWFYFLTKPIFHILDTFNRWLGNYGLAILLLTVIIKALFFPLANKSYTAMSKLKKLQPEMTKMRERYGNDRQRMQQAMMELYRKEGANPAAGCLPIVIQIPVFFALYKVLYVGIEMRHAPFYGWIKDLAAPDPTTIFNLFGLIPWDPPSFLMLGAWPLLMGISMYVQQMLNPQPADPIQARMFMLMPVIFTFLFATFPAGLVIYWFWNNLLSIAQQWVIMRRMGVPVA